MTKLEYVRSILKGWSLTFDHILRFVTARPIAPIYVEPWEPIKRFRPIETSEMWMRAVDALNRERTHQSERLHAARCKANWLFLYAALLIGFQVLAVAELGPPSAISMVMVVISCYVVLGALTVAAGNYLTWGTDPADIVKIQYDESGEANRLSEILRYEQGAVNTIATDCNTVIEWVLAAFVFTAGVVLVCGL